MCCTDSCRRVLNFGVRRSEGVGGDFVKDVSLTRVNKDTIQLRDRIQMELRMDLSLYEGSREISQDSNYRNNTGVVLLL